MISSFLVAGFKVTAAATLLAVYARRYGPWQAALLLGCAGIGSIGAAIVIHVVGWL